MKKETYKIGDLARELNIKKSLIRHWENEFGLQTHGQSTYSMEDMKVFVHIKELVRTQGLSIEQVKVELEKLPEFMTTPAQKAEDPIIIEVKPNTENFDKQLITLKAELLKLKALLD